MKQIKSLLAVVMILIFSFGRSQAQNTDNVQLYHVHEDVVRPSMLQDYEKTSKEFMDNAKKYNLPGAKWVTTQTNDFRYLYVMPIAKMADLDDRSFWIKLGEKMGKENLDQVFKNWDKCYSTHFDYIIILNKDLSYMPGGITQTPEGQDYRRFYYIHTTPQNVDKLTESLKEVKNMFQKKGSKMEYRVYESGFGVKGKYFMIAIAAKDGATYETMDEANNVLIGADADKVFGEMMKNVTKFEEVTGRMRPDLAYTPK